MMGKRVREVTPANCTYLQLLKMRRDHTNYGDFSLMISPDVVWISEQKWGENRKQHIEIPRGTFNRLLLWYQRTQPKPKRKEKP